MKGITFRDVDEILIRVHVALFSDGDIYLQISDRVENVDAGAVLSSEDRQKLIELLETDES